MKRIVLIVGIGVVAAVIIFVVMVFLTSSGAPAGSGNSVFNEKTNVVTVSQQYGGNRIQYETPDDSKVPSNKMGLQMAVGKSIVVNDIVHAKTTVSDPNVPNKYFISGGLDPVGSDFTYGISYSAIDQSFTVTLLRDPFTVAREQAEADLVAKLGIDPSVACNLRYQVVVPAWASSQYSGQNLRFSNCPGAVLFTQ